MRRVVITGAGTVNALAQNVAETCAALLAGKVGIGPLTCQDVERLTIRIGAQVQGFDADDHFASAQLSRLDRASQFALVAARQAVAGSGIDSGAGVILGTAGGGHQTVEENYRAVFEQGKNRVPPMTVPRLMASAGPSLVAIELGLRGPTFAVSSACASASHAIGLAFQMIRNGTARQMLAGGCDAILSFGGIKAWEGLRVLSPDGCRPFDQHRNGMVMGEGAGVFLLEERGHALRRGATILAEVRGFAMSADAGDFVQPSADGAEATLRAALQDAGLSPADIGYVNAHGTATRANDLVEAQAIMRIFPGGVATSSLKGQFGHTMGASGAIELLACLMALQAGQIAATAGLQTPDPACGLDHVIGTPRRVPVTACLKSAFAFGGLNAVLALHQAE